MWNKMETLPKDGTPFILWDGKEYMMGYWERTTMIKDGYLCIATPVNIPISEQIEQGPYNPIAWHSLPVYP